MHEWSLADAVVSAVDKLARENNASAVKSVKLLIGELQRIDRDAFEFGLKSFLRDFPFDFDVFRFEVEPAAFRCGYCEQAWSLDSIGEVDDEQAEAIHFLPESAHAYVRCPHCGSSDFAVTKGRGVTIGSVELEVPEETPSD